MTITDQDANPLDRATTYRLTVPADAPVTQYWSATVYDRQTHTFIRNAPRRGRSSQSPGLQANADGSVDPYFGPNPPQGKEANWAPTRADGQFEVLFRFYGPQEPLFDKTWRLPDITKLTSSPQTGRLAMWATGHRQARLWRSTGFPAAARATPGSVAWSARSP